MRHSFIKPRKKHLVSAEMRLVLFFFGVTLFMLMSTYLFLAYKRYDFSNEMAQMNAKTQELNTMIEAMDRQIAFIENEAAKAEQVYTSNTVMKEIGPLETPWVESTLSFSGRTREKENPVPPPLL